MGMARGGGGGKEGASAALFFCATLVLWSVSILFEIGFNGRRELAPIVAGFCFFQSANFIVRHLLSSDPLFVNTSVSLLHSTIASLTVVLIVIKELTRISLLKMFEHERLFGGTWPGAYAALCFSCGYFAYDQWDMLRYRLYSGWIPFILAHHLILLVCFTLALYRNVTINYLILTLICELHSIFLHIRKVRRMSGVRNAKSTTVKVEWLANCITFVVARLTCHILITYKLIIDATKFGEGIELPLALFGMVCMNLLNFSLGLDLLRAYRREKNNQLKQG